MQDVEKKYLNLKDLSAYRLAFDFSNMVWDVVVKWDLFAKRTVGMQWVRAADSVSANIAEGFGRRGKKDIVHFSRYSQGSASECFDWFSKAKRRNLLSKNQIEKIEIMIDKLPKELNQLIKFTNEKLKY